MNGNMNIAQLNADCHLLNEQIREAKKTLRSTWTRPMGGVQNQLLTLKRQITELYILRAYARGRVHLSMRPEFCQEVVDRMQSRYQKNEEQAA